MTLFYVRICDEKTLYEPWARKRDKDEKRSHSAKRPPKPIKFSSRSLPREIRCINEPKGFFITDDAGVLVVFVLRGLISDELHVRFSPNTLELGLNLTMFTGSHHTIWYMVQPRISPVQWDLSGRVQESKS